MSRFFFAIFSLLVIASLFAVTISQGEEKNQHFGTNKIANQKKLENNPTQAEREIPKSSSKTVSSIESQSPVRQAFDILNKYASLISAFGALFAAIIALYLGDWKARLERPKLELSFRENKEYPYFQTLAFEPFGISIDIHGQVTDIYRPGFNARVKIVNTGKTAAKNVEAKIEKIKFYRNKSRIVPTRLYHPTMVKWSGERDWKPVDIVPESHFYLDLFWSKNETSTEIYSFNETRIKHYGIDLRNDLLKEIIEDDIQPSQEIYWNVWVDNSYERGLPRKYDIQDDITIYFIVNAENCAPIRFEAIIKWTFETWNFPDIKIRMGKKFINND